MFAVKLSLENVRVLLTYYVEVCLKFSNILLRNEGDLPQIVDETYRYWLLLSEGGFPIGYMVLYYI